MQIAGRGVFTNGAGHDAALGQRVGSRNFWNSCQASAS
jgi:hypothetical protein